MADALFARDGDRFVPTELQSLLIDRD